MIAGRYSGAVGLCLALAVPGVLSAQVAEPVGPMPTEQAQDHAQVGAAISAPSVVQGVSASVQDPPAVPAVAPGGDTVIPLDPPPHAPAILPEPEPHMLDQWDGPYPRARRPLAAPQTAIRPVARSILIPDARWDHVPGGRSWTVAGVRAMASHGQRITETVPRDIQDWCPGYPDADTAQRRAFWVGFLSALAFHESTWNPEAVGGGNLWFGLLQIFPPTADHFKCRARTAAELKDGAANVSCAIRILNTTIPRDRAIAIRDSRWRGVAADWGPMRNDRRVAQMQRWTRAQPYCQADTAPRVALRPPLRPDQGPADAQ